jgi:REP element-mobilizing transposase RayT
MPEHVHVLVYPLQEHYQMSSILRALKESFARWAVKYWRETAPHMLRRICIQRGARTLNRFWQEGGGYDRNLFDWEVIERAIDYIEMNPVRRGLVKHPCEWNWSSARCRAGGKNIPFLTDRFDTVESAVEQEVL